MEAPLSLPLPVVVGLFPPEDGGGPRLFEIQDQHCLSEAMVVPPQNLQTFVFLKLCGVMCPDVSQYAVES
jgi:hypothetical protein